MIVQVGFCGLDKGKFQICPKRFDQKYFVFQQRLVFIVFLVIFLYFSLECKKGASKMHQPRDIFFSLYLFSFSFLLAYVVV